MNHIRNTGILRAAAESHTLEMPGFGTCAIQLSGTFTATLVFEVSITKDVWTTLNVTPPNSTSAVTGATAAGLWFGAVGGMQAIRVRCSAFTSGVINVDLQAILAGGSASSGGGGGGGGDASAANQLLQIADEDAMAAVLGTTTDVTVQGNNTGTINARLRGISVAINDVWDSVSHFFKVSVQNATLAVTQSGSWVIAAGSAVIGHVITDSGSTTAVTGNVATTVADAANVTLGAKADAKSTATDTTPITAMSVWKQISASVQALVTALGSPFQAGASIGNTTFASTVADGANAVEGATTGAKVVTDATGTHQQYLRGLVTFFANALGAGTAAAAHRTTLASDDPAVATLGATTGTKVITDANGTIQQYLRGLIYLLITSGQALVTVASKTIIQKQILGTAQTVFNSSTDIAAGNFSAAGTDFDNTSDGACPLALYANAMIEMPDWASAPVAGTTVDLYGLLINVDGTDDDTDAPSGTAAGGARYLGSWTIAAADALQRRTIVIPLAGIQSGFTPYIRNGTAQNMNNDGGTNMVLKITPWTLGQVG